MGQVGAQLQLISMEPCSAFAPHYQTDAGETLYLRTGTLDVSLRVDGRVISRTLIKGDLMTVPPGARSLSHIITH